MDQENINLSERLKNHSMLITGGAGFIGSHLASQLLMRGVREIIVVDSLEHGNLNNLDINHPAVTFLQFTLGADPIEQLEPYLKRCDYLFHLAAQKHNQSLADPHAIFRTNMTGTADLFELAGKCGVKKIIFSSSLYAYGKMTLPAMHEADVPAPTTIYGISKLTGEHLLAHYAAKYQFECVTLRYFFVYGPKQFAGTGYKSVIVKNFERMVSGHAPIIFGDGTQALDYIYIDDVIQATLLALACDYSGQVVNVGSGVAISINELTHLMLHVFGKLMEVRYELSDWTAGSIRLANTAKINHILRWKPEISLETGLRNTLKWMQEEYVC